MSKSDVPDGLPEELHELWRSTCLRREAARLSVAFEKAERDWHAAEDEAIKQPQEHPGRKSISEKTKSRAAVFKQIKDKNPHLSYAQVATRANLDCGNELDKIVGDYDVRNAYTAMGWKWERADRIR